MKKRFYLVPLMLLMLLVACNSCTQFGACNTTPTNIGVTSYEAAGAVLTQAYNTEKMLLATGKITAQQDADFQLGVYAKAVTCYKAMGNLAVVVIVTKDIVEQKNAQDKFNALNTQLPTLIANVLKFIEEVK